MALMRALLCFCLSQLLSTPIFYAVTAFFSLTFSQAAQVGQFRASQGAAAFLLQVINGNIFAPGWTGTEAMHCPPPGPDVVSAPPQWRL